MVCCCDENGEEVLEVSRGLNGGAGPSKDQDESASLSGSSDCDQERQLERKEEERDELDLRALRRVMMTPKRHLMMPCCAGGCHVM